MASAERERNEKSRMGDEGGMPAEDYSLFANYSASAHLHPRSRHPPRPAALTFSLNVIVCNNLMPPVSPSCRLRPANFSPPRTRRSLLPTHHPRSSRERLLRPLVSTLSRVSQHPILSLFTRLIEFSCVCVYVCVRTTCVCNVHSPSTSIWTLVNDCSYGGWGG